MKLVKPFLAMLLSLPCASGLLGQDMKAANPASAPPSLLLLVHQEIQPGKASERQKLASTIARACDRLEAPSFWINLQSLTGPRETLSFDPFNSFEDLEQAHIGWKQFFAVHPDLAQTQGEIDSLVSSERTIVAVRRDDLGYLAESIDLSETRYMRVLEVRLFPGHESDFAESMKLMGEENTRIKADRPWVVYQVNVGTQSPTFLVFLPMSELKQNDDLLSQRESILAAAEGETADRLKQIAREAYANTESNLYVVSPEISHVSKEFAAGDPDFWRHGASAEWKLDVKPDAKPSTSPVKSKSSAKPSEQ